MATLREKQIASIERILNLNAPIQQVDSHEANISGSLPANAPILSQNGEPIWKVLVFDDLGRDVISSVLRVNDLRQWGVTIHLNINTARHAIPDVPVIYLVRPTAANLQIITSDLSRNLYSPAYINFLSSIPRPLLEDFAAETATSGTAEHLSQLYDQYLNFIVAEPDLFSLGLNNAYSTLSSASTSDQVLDALVDDIVSGLFSVVVTNGTVPIIRCPKAGPAELLSTKLDRKLRDHILNSKTNLFSGEQKNAGATASRPVLIIADRNVDLVPMFSHSWTYQSLITDLLSMRLNKIEVPVAVDDNNPEKGTKKQSYDLTANDFFWLRNATKPFPDVADDIDKELKKYEEDASEVTKRTGTSSIDELQGGGAAIAAHLKGALSLLPELKERKALLSMHMNILKALIKGIEDRKVHEYFQLEEELSKQGKAQILEVIKGSDKGNDPLDKLRYFLQWYLTTEAEVSRTDLESFTQALEAAGADTTPIKYIKTVRQLTRMTMLSSAPTPTQSQAPSSIFGLRNLSARVTDRFKDAGLPANFDGLLSGIQNLIPKDKDLTLTKITESLMDPQNASSSALQKTENWLYFDPRSANARGTMPAASSARANTAGAAGAASAAVGRGIEASFGARRSGHSEAIVFTVGGGSMDEYGNLMEWARRTGSGGSGAGAGGVTGLGGAGSSVGGMKRRVVYGSTALLSSREFVEGLAVLGRESS